MPNYNFTTDDLYRPPQLQRPLPPSGPNPVGAGAKYISDLFGGVEIPVARTTEIQNIPGNMVNLPGRADALDKLIANESLKRTYINNIPMVRENLNTVNNTAVTTPAPKNFREAFREARKAGLKVFDWNGKKYNTKLASDNRNTSGAGTTSIPGPDEQAILQQKRNQLIESMVNNPPKTTWVAGKELPAGQSIDMQVKKARSPEEWVIRDQSKTPQSTWSVLKR